jgi:hypothetical protein
LWYNSIYCMTTLYSVPLYNYYLIHSAWQYCRIGFRHGMVCTSWHWHGEVNEDVHAIINRLDLLLWICAVWKT